MSSHRRRSSDGSAEAAGCLIFLLTFGFVMVGKRLYEVFRYKPAPYHPVAPHIPHEVGLSTQDIQRIALLGLVGAMCLFGGLSQSGSTIRATRDGAFIWFAFAAGNGWLAYDRYQRAKKSKLDAAHLDLTPLYPSTPATYAIDLPRSPVNLSAGVNLLRSLLEISSHLAFQIVADGQQIRWQVIDPHGAVSAEQVSAAVRSQYPSAVVDALPVVPPLSSKTSTVYQQYHYFGLANEYPTPIATLDMLKTDDPLIPIAQRMDFLRPDLCERLIYSLLVITPSNLAKVRAKERLKEGSILPLSSVPTQREADNLHELDERLLNAKLAGNLYHAFLVVSIESDQQSRLAELADIVADVTRFAIPRHNHMARSGESRIQQIQPANSPLSNLSQDLFAGDILSPQAAWRPRLLVLQPSELAALWHLPDERFTAEKIEWAGRPIPAAVTKAGDDRVLLGTTVGRGQAKPVYLTLSERAHHLYTAGKTGVGKSTLLHNLIHQDIVAGRGVAVLDPHGKLIDAIVERSIPASRQQDVVILDCARQDRPVPLNPFRVPEGIAFSSADTYVYWVMRKIYEGIWNEGRMDMVMRNVIQALLTDPEATPLDIDRLLTNDAYRQQIIQFMNAHEEVSFGVINYWQEFTSKSGGQRREIAQPILNRTRAFVGNRTLEGMTCNPQGLNFQSLIRDRKIVLVRLAGDAIRNEVGSLGAIFFSGFYLASETLGYLPDNAPPRFYLYVDEVERFISTPLVEMFSQARKFGLSLTLANQFLNQLPKETLDSILGNVGTQVLFEVGNTDAYTLEPLLKPDMKADTLLNLGQYRMVIKTRAEGRTLPAFMVAGNNVPAAVGKAATNLANGLDFPTREAVRAWLAERYAPPPASPPVNGEAQPTSNGDTPATTNDGLADYE